MACKKIVDYVVGVMLETKFHGLEETGEKNQGYSPVQIYMI